VVSSWTSRPSAFDAALETVSTKVSVDEDAMVRSTRRELRPDAVKVLVESKAVVDRQKMDETTKMMNDVHKQSTEARRD
jgi:hypothetical protein